MKTKIIKYLKASPLKKKLIFSLKKAPWFEILEKEFTEMKLPAEWNVQRKLWHYWNNTNLVPLCSISGKERKWRAGRAVESIDVPGMSEGYSMFSDSKSAGKGNAITNKRKLEEKYGKGITNVFQLEEIKNKCKNTLIRKYGVDNISKLEEIKNRKANVMLERYGYKYNFNNAAEFMMKKYGVSNPIHLPHVIESSCQNRFKKRHPVILNNGETIYLQGYEPQGFEYLSKIHKQRDIIYKKSGVPKIQYTENDKSRIYYCDFFIPNKNLVVEIKSPYTYRINKEGNDLKLNAAKTSGFDVLLLIFDQNGLVSSSSGPIDL